MSYRRSETRAIGIPVSKLAATLAYVGLVPFVGATGAMFSADPATSGVALYVLTVYAAVILSFAGAIHCGLAMNGEHTLAHWQLGFGIGPALAAWLLLVTLPPLGALIGLGTAFLIVFAVDLMAITYGLAPTTYTRLFVVSTIVICASLWTAAWTLAH